METLLGLFTASVICDTIGSNQFIENAWRCPHSKVGFLVPKRKTSPRIEVRANTLAIALFNYLTT
jgi:hypothetical protein